MLRFNESYSVLAGATNQSDWFDPIKYIPLQTSIPNSYLTLGGEWRERFEGANNVDFGIQPGDDHYWLQRITLLGDVHLGGNLRFFVEGISGVASGAPSPAPTVQEDPFDLQCAFVEFVPYPEADGRLTLRAGRFGLSLGSGRLVATRAAPNIPFRFDGLEALFTSGPWAATAFLTRPVKDSGNFGGDDYSTAFWGAYVTRWLDGGHKSGVDLYYLGIWSEHSAYASGTADEHRHSFGVRVFGERNGWDWNMEEVLQVGSFGAESILAWTGSIDGGYTFDADLRPRLGLKFDVTSGDENPHDGRLETFDALYFKSGYFNDASLIRPQNEIDIHPNVGVKLSRSVSADSGIDAFWRYSRSDAVYAPPGFIAIPPLSSAPNYIGTALDLNLQWQIQRHLSLQASYVHFVTGTYIHDAGGADVNYFSTTLDFLF